MIYHFYDVIYIKSSWRMNASLSSSAVFTSRSVFPPWLQQMSALPRGCASDSQREEDAVSPATLSSAALGRAPQIWMLRKNGHRRREEAEGAAATLGLKHRVWPMDVHGDSRTDLIYAPELHARVHTEETCRKRRSLVSVEADSRRETRRGPRS